MEKLTKHESFEELKQQANQPLQRNTLAFEKLIAVLRKQIVLKKPHDKRPAQ